MIHSISDNQQVIETDYCWPEHAKRQLFYLSWNDDTLRLFVLDANARAAMLTGSHVYIIQGTESIKLIFDDSSDAPFTVEMQQEMSDIRSSEFAHERCLPLLIYGPDGFIFDKQAIFFIRSKM
jgi:hypothetical protein